MCVISDYVIKETGSLKQLNSYQWWELTWFLQISVMKNIWTNHTDIGLNQIWRDCSPFCRCAGIWDVIVIKKRSKTGSESFLNIQYYSDFIRISRANGVTQSSEDKTISPLSVKSSDRMTLSADVSIDPRNKRSGRHFNSIVIMIIWWEIDDGLAKSPVWPTSKLIWLEQWNQNQRLIQ